MRGASSSVAAGARRWRHDFHAAVCDHVEPWEHGTVVRAGRYPTYYDLNVVRAEQDPQMGVEELIALAEHELAGLGHLRLDFEDVASGDARRAELHARGFETSRLVTMHRERPLPPGGPAIGVERVPYEEADELRLAWHLEDHDGKEYERYRIAVREIAEAREVEVLAAREDGRAIGFAQLERAGGAAEITQVYVDPPHRGTGCGTALTRAAIEAAGEVGDLWIVADDEDRPKDLYARLGFDPAWCRLEALLLR